MWKSYFRCALFTTWNILLYAITFGRYIWLEGRVSDGKFRNWIRAFDYLPVNFARPATEAEIIELVKNANKIRVFGSGHSFNPGIQTDGTLISLDRYSGVIRKDLAQKQMTFKAGTRIREVNKILHANGLAFSALPSHDAQSLAGIISTDVHGTGKNWGFVSEAVTKLKIVDGKGDVFECTLDEDLFKAAIGGIGMVGIITEVTVQAVERFHVAQKSWITDLEGIENNLDKLIEDNDHVSLYLFPFTKKCQVNTWNRTTRDKATFAGLREFLAISLDAFVSVWFGNLLAYSGLLQSLSNLGYGLKKGTNLVMESYEGFNRTIYPLHQELEFAIPFADTIAMCRYFVDLFQEKYAAQKLPYTLFEIRFTPAGHDKTLIGAGRERRSTWIDVVCNDSEGYRVLYEAIEEELKRMEARPHLGKYCRSFNRGDFERLHPETFPLFCELKEAHDPEGKFSNPFTQKLFAD